MVSSDDPPPPPPGRSRASLVCARSTRPLGSTGRDTGGPPFRGDVRRTLRLPGQRSLLLPRTPPGPARPSDPAVPRRAADGHGELPHVVLAAHEARSHAPKPGASSFPADAAGTRGPPASRALPGAGSQRALLPLYGRQRPSRSSWTTPRSCPVLLLPRSGVGPRLAPPARPSEPSLPRVPFGSQTPERRASPRSRHVAGPAGSLLCHVRVRLSASRASLVGATAAELAAPPGGPRPPPRPPAPAPLKVNPAVRRARHSVARGSRSGRPPRPRSVFHVERS